MTNNHPNLGQRPPHVHQHGAAPGALPKPPIKPKKRFYLTWAYYRNAIELALMLGILAMAFAIIWRIIQIGWTAGGALVDWLVYWVGQSF